MGKILRITLVVSFILLLVGIVFSQSSTPISTFTEVQQIGLPSPQGIRYDPKFDRFAMVTTEGQLVLVDAKTRETQYVLYENGNYYGYEFSNNGQWIAVARQGVVDIWNTQSGEKDLELQPTVALEFSALLQWSDDDELLMFKAVVPAPDAIRRSEDDTTLTPWLWDLEAERRNRTSILPERRTAQPFFDLRTDLLLAPNNILIAALPRSLGMIDFSEGSYNYVTNMNTDRFEFDPIDIWYSMQDRFAYFRNVGGNQYFQINTENATIYTLPIGRELGQGQIAAQSRLQFGDVAQIIGETGTLNTNSFLRLLLGNRYQPNEAPITVTLLDILDPVTVSNDQFGFLIYLENMETAKGTVDLVRPEDVSQMTLHPARTHIAVRRNSGDRAVEIYELRTGNLVNTFIPRYPDVDLNRLFEFNESGDELLVGWARYNTFTGEPVVEAPRFHPGFEAFNFSVDENAVVTINSNDMWVWDIATGQPIRREQIELNGQVIDSTDDGLRYLTRIPFEGEQPLSDEAVEAPTEVETDQNLFGAEDEDPDVVSLLQEIQIPNINVPLGAGVEDYDVATDERRRVYFEQLPNRNIQQIIASSDWEHYLVVYEANPFSPYYPGNEVAIYRLGEGLVWFYAGDDLPAPSYRRYGWRDNNTAFVVSGRPNGRNQPVRIYGLDYHGSGLPLCLVEAFPYEWEQWRGLWEEFNATLDSDDFGRLTQKICEASPQTIEEFEAVLSPTPTPTRPPIKPTSSRIAGLPSCLSSYFGRDARLYAPQWRALTDGLDDEQTAEVEEILCAGLREGVNLPVPNVGYSSNNHLQTVSIDVITGEREISSFAPFPTAEARPLAPVLRAFRGQYGFEPLPENVSLSSSGDYLAVHTNTNHVTVYRLNRPYQSFIDELHATQDASLQSQPASVSILETATAPGIELGVARPTLTPTITPTAPPLPQATIVSNANSDVVIELCDDMTLYPTINGYMDYTASGKIIANEYGRDTLIYVDPSNSRFYYDLSLIDPSIWLVSPSQDYMLIQSEEIMVAEVDSENPQVLFESFESQYFPYDLQWIDGNTLSFSLNQNSPESSPNVTVTNYYTFDAESG